MDTNVWIAIFVTISAVALCMQTGFLFGVYRTAKNLEGRVNPLIPKVESLVDSTKATVEQSKLQILDITTKANEILDSTKEQLAIVEDVVSDAASRAKVQMERVEMVLDDTMSRAHETVATVHNGIMRPLRELNGIAVGIKTAFAYLSRGNRPSVDRVTSDEEMFI
jgi:hypothetical protein